MASYKEIVTKAVVGKGKKYFKNNYMITPAEVPTTVLGCWVINHKFKGYKTGDKVGVDGSYDVNIWHSYDNDSKTSVVTKKVDYNEKVSIKVKEENTFSNETEIIIRALKQPNCTRVEIKDGNIEFEVEKELGVELVGDTKVKIAVETDEEVWDTVEEDILTEDVEREIEESINEDYLK